ncbi:hypothetical protein Tco_0720223 [Tanacetum coccineum]
MNDIAPLIERVMDQNHSFVPMDSELEVQRLKRAGQEVLEEPAKRQKTREETEPAEESKNKESMEPSQEQLQQPMFIVPEEGMNVEALSIEPTDDKDRALWVELKRLFEPNTDDLLELQRYMHDSLTWRLYDTCGVHHMSTETGLDMFMLINKDYPLTKELGSRVLIPNFDEWRLTNYRVDHGFKKWKKCGSVS